jgi:CRP-like cAMP-binding protein
MRFSDYNSKIEQISNLDLFRSCNRRQVRVINGLCDSLEVARGRILCSQGSPTRQALVIIAGTASAAVDGEFIGTVVPGSLLGHRTVLYREPARATVTTTTRAQLLVFSARDFLALAIGDPALAPSVRKQTEAADPLLHPAVGNRQLVQA